MWGWEEGPIIGVSSSFSAVCSDDACVIEFAEDREGIGVGDGPDNGAGIIRRA